MRRAIQYHQALPSKNEKDPDLRLERFNTLCQLESVKRDDVDPQHVLEALTLAKRMLCDLPREIDEQPRYTVRYPIPKTEADKIPLLLAID